MAYVVWCDHPSTYRPPTHSTTHPPLNPTTQPHYSTTECCVDRCPVVLYWWQAQEGTYLIIITHHELPSLPSVGNICFQNVFRHHTRAHYKSSRQQKHHDSHLHVGGTTAYIPNHSSCTSLLLRPLIPQPPISNPTHHIPTRYTTSLTNPPASTYCERCKCGQLGAGHGERIELAGCLLSSRHTTCGKRVHAFRQHNQSFAESPARGSAQRQSSTPHRRQS